MDAKYLAEIKARCYSAKSEKAKGNDLDCACLSWAIVLTDIPVLIAEVERLRQDKECCLQTAKCNAGFYDEAKKENSTLKKALELACEDLAERDYPPKNVESGKNKFVEYFIQQAQEQEGKK